MGGVPRTPCPGGVLAQGWQCHQAWQPPAGDPAATPWQVGTQEGQGWARLGGCAGRIPAARTPPSHVRAPQGAHPGLPGWVQGGERWRWETGGAQEAPGERVGMGVAWGGMGRGPRTLIHTHTHAKVWEY